MNNIIYIITACQSSCLAHGRARKTKKKTEDKNIKCPRNVKTFSKNA